MDYLFGWITQEGVRDGVVDRLEDCRFADCERTDCSQCGDFANEQNAVAVVSCFISRDHQSLMNVGEDGFVLRDYTGNRKNAG